MLQIQAGHLGALLVHRPHARRTPHRAQRHVGLVQWWLLPGARGAPPRPHQKHISKGVPEQRPVLRRQHAVHRRLQPAHFRVGQVERGSHVPGVYVGAQLEIHCVRAGIRKVPRPGQLQRSLGQCQRPAGPEIVCTLHRLIRLSYFILSPLCQSIVCPSIVHCQTTSKHLQHASQKLVQVG